MDIIIFLSVVGWLVGAGIDLGDKDNTDKTWLIYVGNLLLWPISIGRAIGRRD